MNRPARPFLEEENRAISFFESAYSAFEQAECASGDPTDRVFSIAGHTIRLRFANPSLVPLITPAFEHLTARTDASPPELTICLWDSGSTGVRMPRPAWSWEDYIARGEVRGYESGNIHTAYQLGSHALSMLDDARDLAIYWVRDDQLPYYERACPLRPILTWWLARHACLVVHSAAVGNGQGGVLIAGKGGAGKSTTALLCLQAGLDYVGDNNVVLGHLRAPSAHSIYSSAALDADQIQRLSFLVPAIQNSQRLASEKALVFLKGYYPNQLAAALPLRAILMPRITGRVITRLVPASPAQSLAALAPSTIFSSPGAGQTDFQFMAQFVRRLPSYTLELGTDLALIPEVIMDLLSEDGRHD